MPSSSDDIVQAILSFNQNAIAARKKLADLYDENTHGFLEKCLPALRANVESPGGQYLVAFLLGNNLLEAPICDGSLITAEQAAAVLRVAKRVDPSFEVRLLRMLGDGTQNSYALARLLEVLALTSQPNRLMPFLTQMMRHRDRFIQSKAALLIGRLKQNADWVRQRLGDPDLRVRANAIESLWGESSDEAKELFRQVISNSCNRIAGNGLVGLYLAGEPEALKGLLDMATHSAPLFQATAIWGMGYVGDPRFLPFLAEAMGKCEESMRPRIFDAIRKIRHRRDQVASFGSLRVYFISADRLDNGGRRVRFSAFDPARRELLDAERLRATHVIVTEGQSTPLEYSVRAAESPKAMTLGFVLPAPSAAGSDFNTALARHVQGLRQVRRPADKWIEYFYRVPDREPDAKAIPLWADPADALGKIWPELVASTGSRHVVVAGDANAPLRINDVAAWIEQAKRHSITIHTILPESPGTTTLLRAEALSRETGGFALRFADAEAVTRNIELILTSVIAPFDVTYSQPGADENGFPEIRVQIFGPRGTGESSGFLKPTEVVSDEEAVAIES